MRIDCIITSCRRYGYLEKTLESLVRYNDTNINQIFIYEDSSEVVEVMDLCDKFDAIPILGGGNRGQIHAIDELMLCVTTPFYLHLEDDWECNEFGFIPEAIAMFGNPEIVQVNGRGRTPKALNGHPVKNGYLSNDYHGWNGWMYAPTVNRTDEYERRVSFQNLTTWNTKTPWECEKQIGSHFKGFKYVTEKQYFTHIGEISTYSK